MLSLIFRLIVCVRNKMFDKGWLRSQSFPIPIICVGNLAVGGTGKTPHVEYILRLLHQNGYHVAMLSRGYGRKTKGYILAQNGQHTADEIGDEPYQIMQNCPFATIAVCEKRAIGIVHLMGLSPKIDVIVLDDAYQHRYVRAGYNILLTDAARPYEHDHLLPYGRLREPASSAKRADAVIVTKCRDNHRLHRPQLLDHQMLFYSQIAYVAAHKWGSLSETIDMKGMSVLLLTGIANPQPLLDYVEIECGAREVTLLSYHDHHRFTTSDAQRIMETFENCNADILLTTQKDASRLYPILPLFPSTLVDALAVQPITVKVSTDENNKSFNQTILDYVSTNKRNC